MSTLRLFLGPAPLQKSHGAKPPPGYHVAPGSKHGGFTDGHGGYWYPGHAGTVHAIPPGKAAADAVAVPASGPGSTFALTSHASAAKPMHTAIVHVPTGRVLAQVQGQAKAVAAVEALHDQHTGMGASSVLGGGLAAADFSAAKSTIATAVAAAPAAQKPGMFAAAPAGALASWGGPAAAAAWMPAAQDGAAFALSAGGLTTLFTKIPGGFKFNIKPSAGPNDIKPSAFSPPAMTGVMSAENAAKYVAGFGKIPTPAPAAAPPPAPAAPVHAFAMPTNAATLVKVGNKPGGAFAGAVVASPDAPGEKFMVKPASPRKVQAEAAGSQLSAMVLGDGKVGIARAIDLTGAPSDVGKGLASIQRMMPNSGDIPKDRASLAALDPDLQAQVIASHVANWLASDHDAHGGQYLRSPDGKSVIKIDLGQSFKHLGTDKLDTGYHPNAAYGEAKPAPLQIMESFEKGEISLDLNSPHILAAINAAEAIPDATVEGIVGPYAAVHEKFGGPAAATTLGLAVGRKNSVRADFEAWFSQALTRRMGKPVAFKFGQAPAMAKGFLSFDNALMKSAQRSGVAPLSLDAILAPDQTVRPEVEPMIVAFAQAVQARFGAQVVRVEDLARFPPLEAAYDRLAALPGLLDDILTDPPTRVSAGAIK